MARLYTNENFPFPVAHALRRLGHDVLTVQEAGQADRAIPDEEVLAYAAGERRILLTINRKHFVKLHRSHALHAGIVVCTLDPDFEGQARRIHDALSAEPAVEGKLLRVNRPQT